MKRKYSWPELSGPSCIANRDPSGLKANIESVVDRNRCPAGGAINRRIVGLPVDGPRYQIMPSATASAAATAQGTALRHGGVFFRAFSCAAADSRAAAAIAISLV